MRRSLTTVVAAFTVAAVLGVATEASACRQRVFREGELAQHTTLVIATVKTAERLETPGWNTWRIVAESPPDDGASGPLTYEFTTALSSNGCGQTPLPPAGERWVVYLDRTGSTTVLDAFPLEYARPYDARLSNLR